MKLKVGDVLVKKRSGNTRRVRVVRLGRLSAILEDLAASTRDGSRHSVVKTHAVNLSDDGLPDGYGRAES